MVEGETLMVTEELVNSSPFISRHQLLHFYQIELISTNKVLILYKNRLNMKEQIQIYRINTRER
jgi:hypothetical protein